MKKKKPKGTVAELQEFYIQRKFAAWALILFLANVFALLTVNANLGGDAMTGRTEDHHYFVRRSVGYSRSGQSRYTEVSQADFEKSLAIGYSFSACAVILLLCAYAECAKDERSAPRTSAP